MRATTESEAGPESEAGRRRGPGLVRKVLWFAALWAAGVVAVAALAFGLRLMLGLD